jgi:epimerase transport system membrane fusion protein
VNNKSDIVPASKGKALVNAISTDASGMVGASANGEVETGIEAPLRVGLTIAFLVFGVFGLWSVLAPIESSAHAQGFVTPRSFKKPIQHLEGGIVKEVLVQNGDVVEANDVLLIMDATRPQSELGIINGQMLSLLAMEARLLAERTNAEAITYPQELQEAGAKGMLEMNAQNQIFNTRKAALEGNVAVLQQRISQLEAQAEGLQALRESKEGLAASYAEELESVQSLLSEGFESRVRLREMERALASATGEVAELMANIASTEIRIGETELEIQQQQNTFQTEVASELSDVQNQLKDARERFTTLTDIVARTEVRTTAAGIVNGLKVHSPGSVIPPGDIVAEVVPQNDELVIDAALPLGDIDRVSAGQKASIRFTSLNAKRTPNLYGTVLSVSADSFTDQNTGASYYNARVAVDDESLADLEDMVLVSGMPAEVFIATGSRTFMSYMMRSVTDSWARSFRED